MKIKLLSFAFIATLISCGEATTAENSSTETETKVELSDDQLIDEGTSENMDLVASIVTKGGAKAADQQVIEDMLSSIESQKALEGWESDVVGHWVGNFGKNKINISITKIDGEMAEGFSVCAGNFRKIEGTVISKDNGFHFVMNEPGNDQYDGAFDFTIAKDLSGLSGAWTPFEKEGNTAKTYSLTKKEFIYDAGAGDYPETSVKKLKYTDVENLDVEELGYMRNEIYARHGYSFKNKDWRYIFEGKDWYVPMGVDIRHQLTDIEVENIGLIYEYESYFDEYYDEYGR